MIRTLLLVAALLPMNLLALDREIPPNEWQQLSIPTNVDNSIAINVLEQLFDSVPGAIGWIYEGEQYRAVNRANDAPYIAQGGGFWYRHTSPASITITADTGTTVVSQTLCDPEVACSGSNYSQPNWYMIGSAYDQPMTASEGIVIRTVNDDRCSGACTFDEAVQKGVISAPLWHWNGTSYQNLASSTIQPFQAFWIRTYLVNVEIFQENPYCPAVTTN